MRESEFRDTQELHSVKIEPDSDAVPNGQGGFYEQYVTVGVVTNPINGKAHIEW